MKIIKTKIATALVLGAISFGMFSFTTTPINAQSTNSVVTVANEAETAGIRASAARRLAGFVVFAVAAAVEVAADYLFGYEDAAIEYPGNTLD